MLTLSALSLWPRLPVVLLQPCFRESRVTVFCRSWVLRTRSQWLNKTFSLTWPFSHSVYRLFKCCTTWPEQWFVGVKGLPSCKHSNARTSRPRCPWVSHASQAELSHTDAFSPLCLAGNLSRQLCPAGWLESTEVLGSRLEIFPQILSRTVSVFLPFFQGHLVCYS